MTHTLTALRGLLLGPVAAIAIAGCGGAGSSQAANAPSTSGSRATVEVADDGLGKMLVDAQGRTLYLFANDTSALAAR